MDTFLAAPASLSSWSGLTPAALPIAAACEASLNASCPSVAVCKDLAIVLYAIPVSAAKAF